MDTSAAGKTQAPSGSEAPSFRDLLSDAIRYWEPRRLGYNAFLAVIVVGWVAVTWPHFRTAFTWQSLLFLFVLAVLSNVCYCAAYVVDVPMQYSVYRDLWRRWRWGLWIVGALFAGSITYYWIADEIYPAMEIGRAHV